MYLYKTDNFFYIIHYLKSVSKVALLHMFYCIRPMKSQTSLRIRAVWSVFVVRMKKLCILSYHIQDAPKEDSDECTDIWVFAGRTCPKVRFLKLRPIL